MDNLITHVFCFRLTSKIAIWFLPWSQLRRVGHMLILIKFQHVKHLVYCYGRPWWPQWLEKKCSGISAMITMCSLSNLWQVWYLLWFRSLIRINICMEFWYNEFILQNMINLTRKICFMHLDFARMLMGQAIFRTHWWMSRVCASVEDVLVSNLI